MKKRKPHAFDGMFMGSPTGAMLRVYEPRWWQLRRRAWWFWYRHVVRGLALFAPDLARVVFRGQTTPVVGTTTLDVDGGKLVVRVVEDRSIRLPNVPRHSIDA